MVTYPNSFELIIGTKKDPVFGSVIMVGMGGTAAEVFPRSGVGVAAAQRVAGPPDARITQVVAAVAGLSRQAGREHRSADRDHHAVLVSGGRLSRDQGVGHQSAGRHARGRDRAGRPRGGRSRVVGSTTVRPYPTWRFGRIRKSSSPSGSSRTARRWSCGRSSRKTNRCGTTCCRVCSTESLRSGSATCSSRPRTRWPRGTASSTTTARSASWPKSKRTANAKLIGVGRLVADVNHEAAEYAVLVADQWHGRGLGKLLTRYCVDVAKNWGVSRVVAETAKNNHRMLSIFRGCGFSVNDQQEEDVVLVLPAACGLAVRSALPPEVLQPSVHNCRGASAAECERDRASRRRRNRCNAFLRRHVRMPSRRRFGRHGQFVGPGI
jgi:acetyltransferase